MNDLINEEEFYIKEYNPWKRFSLFYGIGVLMAAIAYVLALQYAEFPEIFDSVTGVYFLFPVLMPFVMIFSRKKNRYLPKSKLYLGVFLLMTSYFLFYALLHPVFGVPLFSFGDIAIYKSIAYYMCLSFCVIYIVDMLLIFSIIYLLNRRNNKRFPIL